MSPTSKSPETNSTLSIFFIFTAFGSYVLTLIFNGLSGSGAGVPDIFLYTVGDISDMFELFITPAGFAFTIWTLIYIWLSIGLIVFIITIFLKSDNEKLYLNPAIATPSVMATLTINFLLNFAWIFVWDRSAKTHSLLILAFIILLLTAVTNIMAVAFFAKNIINSEDYFERSKSMFWWGVVYRVVLNGFATYTTWTVIATLINLTTALVYFFEVEDKTASLVALSLLVLIHCTWFVIENFVFEQYARYIWTPYLVVIWAVNAIRAKKANDPDVPDIVNNYVLAILIIACITVAIRAVLVIFRIYKRSKYQQHV